MKKSGKIGYKEVPFGGGTDLEELLMQLFTVKAEIASHLASLEQRINFLSIHEEGEIGDLMLGKHYSDLELLEEAMKLFRAVRPRPEESRQMGLFIAKNKSRK
jgi:hypothetical protein